jgi:hypothetical protein
VLGLAAQLSYCFFLALFPAILFVLVASFCPLHNLTDDIGRSLLRLVTIGLTLGLAVFLLCALSLVRLGPSLAETLGRRAGWSAPSTVPGAVSTPSPVAGSHGPALGAVFVGRLVRAGGRAASGDSGGANRARCRRNL